MGKNSVAWNHIWCNSCASNHVRKKSFSKYLDLTLWTPLSRFHKVYKRSTSSIYTTSKLLEQHKETFSPQSKIFEVLHPPTVCFINRKNIRYELLCDSPDALQARMGCQFTRLTISCDKLMFRYASRSSSSFEPLIITGVIKWEISTDTGTSTNDRGIDSQWKMPPFTHITNGIYDSVKDRALEQVFCECRPKKGVMDTIDFSSYRKRTAFTHRPQMVAGRNATDPGGPRPKEVFAHSYRKLSPREWYKN